jgi:hypothetical protein
MRESFSCIWEDVAKFDDFVFHDCHHLRQGVIHHAFQEGVGLLPRKAVNGRQVPLFRGDSFDDVTKRRRI